MFKSSRWRGSEKNKIKTVFKLQFQATQHSFQVPQVGGGALMISLVPADVGKPTVRLEKAAIGDGICRWENPIYETVKFVREPKTGKINEKIYHFVVSNGSSKAGLLGEVTIDFADYAEAIKPSSVSLPLKTPNSSAVLHVTIQKMQGAVDQKEVGENGDATVKSQDRSLKSQLSKCDTDESSNHNEDGPLNKMTSQKGDSNVNLRASSGSDATSASGSDSSSGRNTPRELGSKNNINNQNPTIFQSSFSHSPMPQKPPSHVVNTNYQEHQRSTSEWSGGSALDGSIDDLANSSPQASDISIEKLKIDLVVLARRAEVSELELQTLRKQVVKESKRGQDLMKEVGSLKEERDALKTECEQFKALQKHIHEAKASKKLQFESEDPWVLLEEIRQELNYEKDLNANLRLQLQKTQESNSELILAVQDLDEMLGQKNSNETAISENAEEVLEIVSKHKMEDDEEQQALEELVKEHDDAKGAYLLEQKIIDLYSEIEVYSRDRDELETQMEQLALDYEILKQENHDILSKLEQNQLEDQLGMQYECLGSMETTNELETQVENLEKELKKQAQEFSVSLATINELETQVKILEKELEKQAQGFEADLEAVTHAKVEQEQRAIRAEDAFRKTRWNNANRAERLQEEFRRLSIQMASTFDTNEKLAMKALTEASELRLQKFCLEEMLQKANEELGSVKDWYGAELKKLSYQINSKTKQIEQMLLELEDKSNQLERQKKQEEETHAVFSKEILMLRAELKGITGEKDDLSEQAEQKEILRAEMENMKTSIDKTEMLVQRGNVERDELERIIASVRKEADKSLQELNNMRCLKDEKETMVGVLQSEVETLRAQYNDLKHSLFEDELEKENLRKQVLHLKGDLQEKDNAISSIEKKLKDNSGRATVSEGTKTTLRNNKSAPVSRGSKEVATLREKINLLEGQIKLKETALENSTNSFLEKEKDLQNRIEELESRMEELNQNSTEFSEDQLKKETKEAKNVTANGSKPGEGRNIAENLLDSEISTTGFMLDQNGIGAAPIKRKVETCSDKELEVSTCHTNDQGNLSELLTQMELLKKRNKSMEGELKDMQGRYSEISLKFAEVEGERQQLVMTVRNLKNAKKN
ncbi:hypothetical protein HHK36_001126 [Tetracentron sinense]|uniref:C2 NT-type domain-containing protein n=1 Tax=Tetracentron sinense TaxID=13715 RepID=A0A835A296_TETSI|nr:hypothetical protein HHK36_001126 [Tetracentron sinense]